ncbi:MAG: D-glycero-beta-D-manno-heptose-7-phosphate kinase [Armatimonadetes bacterium]|nr:D-glycero-beta-D-manno-heptose-7-phosphate kinase [Armatimonadota bacterium]
MIPSKERLAELIGRLGGRRALVLGDLMLDEYVTGVVSRISPEAPVPVVEVDLDRHTDTPGGAGNVAHNLRALGAEVRVLGVVGADAPGEVLRRRLDDTGVDTSGVLVDDTRPTTVKTRIIAHSQQVVRVDRECREPLADDVAGRLLALLEEQLARGADALLISDYDKGIARGTLAEAAIRACARRRVPATANPKPPNLGRFQGAAVVVLNHLEAEAACGCRLRDEGEIRAAAEALRARLDLGALLVTRGALGTLLVEPGGVAHASPAVPVPVYDVVGAGDTAFSALTLALAAGAAPVEAAALANLAGGAVVRKAGTAVVGPEELREMLGGRAGGDEW